MTNPSVNYEAKKRIVQAGKSRICNRSNTQISRHRTS